MGKFYNFFTTSSQNKTLHETPPFLLASDLFKPDIGILVISTCTIKNDYFFSICILMKLTPLQ